MCSSGSDLPDQQSLIIWAVYIFLIFCTTQYVAEMKDSKEEGYL